jgi:hypothetical protein
MGIAKKLPGQGFKRSWPPPIKMDPALKKLVNCLAVQGAARYVNFISKSDPQEDSPPGG